MQSADSMTPERWERLQFLFDAALGLPPGERSVYLDGACEDTGLRQQVDLLLASTPEDGPGLVSQAVSAGFEATHNGSSIEAGVRFGDYRILKQIGQGGMATVYLAERADDQFQKHVAIKVIQDQFAGASFRSRFLMERQILARLEHPNCCRLIDGGVHEGSPYMVMEYVDGAPFIEYADKRSMSLSERLGLFRQLCSAVAYAHGYLIVHRDIKPSNVLVTADGTVKLLDFGIAKLLDPQWLGVRGAEQTQPLDRMATPAYSSPEQLRGEVITTGADIYSLGAVLHELLTGVRAGRPLEGARKIPKELSAIVQRAMHPEPGRRYGSVGELSDDIERYLSGYPVRARKDSWAYRAATFARRNRIVVAATVLVVASLGAGLWMTAREQRKTRQRFDEVRNLATTFLFEFDEAIRNLGGVTEARKKLVQRALASLETLSRDSEGDPGLQEDVARAYGKISSIQWSPGSPNLGDPQAALESSRKEISIREGLLRTEPQNLVNQRYLATAYSMGAYILRNSLRKPETAKEFDQRGDELFTALEKRAPDDPDVIQQAAMHHVRRGLFLHQAGQLEAALAEHRRAIVARERLAERDSKNLPNLRMLAWAHIYAGDVLGGGGSEINLGRRKEALKETEAGAELLAKLAEREPNNKVFLRDSIVSKHRVSGILDAMGDLPAAIQIRMDSLKSGDRLYEEDPANAEGARDRYAAYSSLGRLLIKANRLDEATRYINDAWATNEQRMALHPAELGAASDQASVEQLRGELALRRKRPAEAATYYARALELRGRALTRTPDDSRLLWRQARGLESLAEARTANGQGAAAEAARREALRIYDALGAKGLLSSEDKERTARLRTLVTPSL